MGGCLCGCSSFLWRLTPKHPCPHLYPHPHRTLKMWREAKCVSTLEGHEGPVLSLAVLATGEVVSGSGGWDC